MAKCCSESAKDRTDRVRGRFRGGHLEFGESMEECARREVLEEAGALIKNIRMRAFTNDIFETERRHYVTVYAVADYDSGDITTREPEKCERWEWFSWEELPQPLFLPVRNLVNQGFMPR